MVSVFFQDSTTKLSAVERSILAQTNCHVRDQPDPETSLCYQGSCEQVQDEYYRCVCAEGYSGVYFRVA